MLVLSDSATVCKYMLINTLKPPQSYANQGPGVCMYGVDVMVMEDLSVKVLEVQWAPDTDLIYGKVDKEFWNETFRTMFLERDEAKTNRYVRCTN